MSEADPDQLRPTSVGEVWAKENFCSADKKPCVDCAANGRVVWDLCSDGSVQHMTDVVDCERTPFFFDDNDVVWVKMLRSAAQSEITRFHHHGDFTNDCN